jgi:hypothetical protein
MRASHCGMEIADVVRQHGAAFRRAHLLSREQHRALDAIEHCRTATLGGHVDVCRDCGFERPAYNSCRNRHCPKCQSLAQARWVARRMQRLLPVGYFHVVFTLPAELRAIARRNGRLVFGLLMESAAATLVELGLDPNRLGGMLGVTAVLHTWTRELSFHPHVHCIVTAGAFRADGERWVGGSARFLFHVDVLGDLFRGKVLAGLRNARKAGDLHLGDEASKRRFDATIDKLYRTSWVVYAKRPFGGAEQVLRYLGRYTHRVGISNQRLSHIDDGSVTFRTKHGRSITLPSHEFLRRFLDHVLPRRFVKIRHYGLLAPAHATTTLERARVALDARCRRGAPCASPPSPATRREFGQSVDWRELLLMLTGIDVTRCSECGSQRIEKRPVAAHGPRAPPLIA